MQVQYKPIPTVRDGMCWKMPFTGIRTGETSDHKRQLDFNGQWIEQWRASTRVTCEIGLEQYTLLFKYTPQFSGDVDDDVSIVKRRNSNSGSTRD